MLKRSKTELATLGMGTGSALGRECVEQPGLSRFASDIENPLLVVPGASITRYPCSVADRQAKACCRFRGKITCTERWPTAAEFIGRQTKRRRSDSPPQLR